MKFCTYTYFDPLANEFIYVGQGTKKRAYEHLRKAEAYKLGNPEFYNRLRSLSALGIEVKIGVQQFSNKEDAVQEEIRLIKNIGWGSNGPLLNKSDGGHGPTGQIQSAASREKQASKIRCSWVLRSPENQEFVVHCISEFCASRDLPMNTFFNRAQRSDQSRIKIGPAAGWSVLSRTKHSKDRSLYVYTYFDPVKKEFMYVGQGTKKRAYEHLELSRKGLSTSVLLCNRLRELHELNIQPIISLNKYSTKEHCSEAEISLIQKIGRLDLGQGTLFNETDGGNGNNGQKQTIQMNLKRSASVSEAKRRTWILRTPEGAVIEVPDLIKFCTLHSFNRTVFSRKLRSNDTNPIKKGSAAGYCVLKLKLNTESL